ncbi:hypothetical protein [Abyssisolibacter fermentans]|uniref:hypothetical protein n=1 Tax=Abyssisolibacter fermentans TaxID=1766203 RepID=UPI0008295FC9|nr:hypothetical protein [Abyssisolibacter fermentans]
MKKKAIYIPLALLITIVVSILFSSCHQNKKTSDKTIVNENIIQIKDFRVNSDSTKMNTSVKGTIFIEGTEEIPEHIHIVAWIEVDPDDWGGVVFYIPKKWNVSNIISSYPENKAQALPAEYVTTWHTTDSELYEWHKFIEIGRDHSYIPTGGGTGTVVIDLVPDENAIQQLEKFNIMIAVGCDKKNGIKILETDSISIEIP